MELLAIPLKKLLAIPLGYQPKNFWPGTRKTVTKWLGISNQKTIPKCLVMMWIFTTLTNIPIDSSCPAG
jgi:hypothetical protein